MRRDISRAVPSPAASRTSLTRRRGSYDGGQCHRVCGSEETRGPGRDFLVDFDPSSRQSNRRIANAVGRSVRQADGTPSSASVLTVKWVGTSKPAAFAQLIVARSTSGSSGYSRLGSFTIDCPTGPSAQRTRRSLDIDMDSLGCIPASENRSRLDWASSGASPSRAASAGATETSVGVISTAPETSRPVACNSAKACPSRTRCAPAKRCRRALPASGSRFSNQPAAPCPHGAARAAGGTPNPETRALASVLPFTEGNLTGRGRCGEAPVGPRAAPAARRQGSERAVRS